MSDVAIIDEAAFIPSRDLLLLAAAPNLSSDTEWNIS